MNRVTQLGPIDVEAKYFKPPVPPILICAVDGDRSSVEIHCKACCDELAPPKMTLLRGRPPAPGLLEVRVRLNRETYRRGQQRADGSYWYQDQVGYVGQCERCQRIYVATTEPTSGNSQS